MLDAGYQRVPLDAGFNPGEEGLPGMHRKVEFPEPITVSDAGYIYIWVSNESENTAVWPACRGLGEGRFDDLKITHSTSVVTQATDYGVWGDVVREQKTDPTVFYKFGYQGQFAEKDKETGWNHFELREYDPAIGRFTTIDPAAQFWSPYIGMGNHPVNKVDPTGGCAVANGNPIPFLMVSRKLVMRICEYWLR